MLKRLEETQTTMTIYTKVILNLLLLSLKLVATSELESKPGISSIEVKGKQFINSQTGEPFLIKGLAYQPGGSADVNEDQDPLSEPTICSRDIPLFQQLGVNTIRVYSINPDLNHDYCMSLLAMAGIYLILDVNSPLPNQHLNRYEPWKSYNPFYMEHVFKVVKQFSNYSNTLAFFAGNEVVNDFKSSQLSPRYVKQLIGDIKMFSDKHCPRTIPIGYSAADDLNYRVSLSNYLACYNDSTPMQIVDFYGVNSYQWCGQQTLKTSGYDLLIDAYKDYSRPVILSEFGCNKVLPRKFGEIEGIFSQEMLKVFSGGLAYEYSQESNNYGLVEILDEGDIKLLSDFHELKNQYCSIDLANVKVEISKDDMGDVPCVDQYKNLNVNMEIAEELSKDLIEDGVEVEVGKHIAINLNKIHINEAIYNADGTPWKDNTGLKVVYDLFPQTKEKTVSKHDEKGKERKETTDSKKKNTATSIKCLSIYDWVVIISAITLLVITMF